MSEKFIPKSEISKEESKIANYALAFIILLILILWVAGKNNVKSFTDEILKKKKLNTSIYRNKLEAYIKELYLHQEKFNKLFSRAYLFLRAGLFILWSSINAYYAIFQIKNDKPYSFDSFTDFNGTLIILFCSIVYLLIGRVISTGTAAKFIKKALKNYLINYNNGNSNINQDIKKAKSRLESVKKSEEELAILTKF